MAVKCLNKNTTFYKSLIKSGYSFDEIAQITDKLDQEAFKNWYGEGELDSFEQPRLVKDLYLINDKGEQITLNDLLNDKFYERRQNYSADLTHLDKIDKFLEEAKVGINKRISAFRDTDYAERLERLLDELNKLNEKDYLQALQRHSEYILKTVEDFELRFYNYDKVNEAKLSKEEKSKRDKTYKNFLLHANNFLQTFSKIKDLEIPLSNSEEKQLIEELKGIETRVTNLQNRVNSEMEASIRDVLDEVISNPEVRQGITDFLAAQVDESKVQLLLDSLGDSHVTFLAAIDKFFKRAMHDKEEEKRRLNREWDEFVKSFNGQFDNFLDKVLEKDKDGDRTSRFIPKYKNEYYDKLYEFINKLNTLKSNGRDTSQEYIDTLNDYYTWKKDNTKQKYKKEYYNSLNLLIPQARKAKEELDLRRTTILDKGLDKLKEEDFEELREIEAKMKSLKSKVNPDGTEKTGEDLVIADSLFKYSKAMSNFYYVKGIKQKAFDKSKIEAEEKGDEYYQQWLINNTEEVFKDTFWTFFKNLMAKLPEKTQDLITIEDEIKQLIISYRNEKGEIKAQDIPENIMKKIDSLELKKKMLKEKINEKIDKKIKKEIAEEFKKHIVFENTSEYLKTFAEKTQQRDEGKISKDEYNRWFRENHETNIFTQEITPKSIWTVMKPKDKGLIINRPNKFWNITDIKPEFINPDFSLDNNGYPEPTNNWIDDKYKNLSEQDIENLDKIQSRLLYLTEHTKNDIIKKGYLPAIPRDNKTAKKNKESFSEKAVTESDEIVRFIPFKYVKKLNQSALPEILNNENEESSEERKKTIEENRKLHGKSINYDLANTMKSFTDAALTNKYKTEIELDIKLFKEQLKRQKIKTIDAKGDKIFDKIKSKVKGEKIQHETSAIGSNTEKHFNEWLESVFYEDFELDEGLLTDWTKKVQDFTSLRALGFNVLSGINNKVIGNIQARIEGAGGVYYNYSDYRKSRWSYFNSLTHIISNRNTDKSTNYYDAFIKHFDILVSQDELSNKQDGALKTVLHKLRMIKDAAYFMQHLGEHQVQNSTLLAMANSHRIVNGKIVNFYEYWESKQVKISFNKKMTDTELTEEFSKMDKNYELRNALRSEFENLPKVIDSFELVDGYLKAKPEIEISKDEFFNFKQRVIGINQRLHGIYNTEDAASIQRYALGRLAMQFRKWMRPGWNRRFGSKFGKKIYNERIRDYEEGMYVTTFKFLFNPLITNYKEFAKSEEKTAGLAFKTILESLKDTFTNAKIRWHSMSELEKANVRKTATEFLFLLAVIGLGFLAKNIKGDDDDNKALTLVLYQADRLFGELTTFTPVGLVREGNRLFTSPSPVFNTFEDVFKLGSNMFLYPFRDEEERKFKTGIYHGQDKVGVYLGDMLPVYNQVQRIKYMGEQNERYGLFK